MILILKIKNYFEILKYIPLKKDLINIVFYFENIISIIIFRFLISLIKLNTSSHKFENYLQNHEEA